MRLPCTYIITISKFGKFTQKQDKQLALLNRPSADQHISDQLHKNGGLNKKQQNDNISIQISCQHQKQRIETEIQEKICRIAKPQ